MQREDTIRIRHMVDGAKSAQQFLTGRQRAELDSNTMLLFALAQALWIVGEAASKVSLEAKSASPSIPWTRIIGMRDRIVHAYTDIDHDIVWKAVTEEIPALLPLLLSLLARD